MNKNMQDEMRSERAAIEAWCRDHGVDDSARAELLSILYGKPALTKGEST